MLDLKFIRENPDTVQQAAKQKRVDVDVRELLALDAAHRAVLQQVEELRDASDLTIAHFMQKFSVGDAFTPLLLIKVREDRHQDDSNDHPKD